VINRDPTAVKMEKMQQRILQLEGMLGIRVFWLFRFIIFFHFFLITEHRSLGVRKYHHGQKQQCRRGYLLARTDHHIRGRGLQCFEGASVFASASSMTD